MPARFHFLRYFEPQQGRSKLREDSLFLAVVTEAFAS
jgi:hypothetical protein